MAVSQACRLLWVTGMFFVVFPHLNWGLLSNYKICGDSECESLMSRVQAIKDHHGKDCRFLSFRRGEIIFVYHKLTGKREDLWAGSIDRQFGYFPKDAVQVEQVHATVEKVVETQESDFFCMDEFGYPIDSSHLNSDDDIDETILNQESEITQATPKMDKTDADSLSTSKDLTTAPPVTQGTDDGPTEEDQSKYSDESAAGIHKEVEEAAAAAPNEQGGSAPSPWLGSSVTGWLGLASKEEPDNVAEGEIREEGQEMEAEASFTSSVTGWLGLGGEGKPDNAVKNKQDDKGSADSFASTMTGWLGFGEEKINDHPAEKEKDEREHEEEQEPAQKFRSRRMSLDLEGSQLHTEEKDEMGTLDWLGNGLSSTLGFGRANQGLEHETATKREDEETIQAKDEQPTPSSWFDTGIGDIFGYRKDKIEVDESPGSDFKETEVGKSSEKPKPAPTEGVETSNGSKLEETPEDQNDPSETEMLSDNNGVDLSDSSSDKVLSELGQNNISPQTALEQISQAEGEVLQIGREEEDKHNVIDDNKRETNILDEDKSEYTEMEGEDQGMLKLAEKGGDFNNSEPGERVMKTADNHGQPFLTQSEINSGLVFSSVDLNSNYSESSEGTEDKREDAIKQGAEIPNQTDNKESADTSVKFGASSDDHKDEDNSVGTDALSTEISTSQTDESAEQSQVSDGMPSTPTGTDEERDGVDEMVPNEGNLMADDGDGDHPNSFSITDNYTEAENHQGELGQENVSSHNISTDMVSQMTSEKDRREISTTYSKDDADQDSVSPNTQSQRDVHMLKETEKATETEGLEELKEAEKQQEVGDEKQGMVEDFHEEENQQELKEVKEERKQGEVEELRGQEEVEVIKRQEEVEVIRRQEELEEIRQQEEVEELRQQEEVEELRWQEEVEELRRQEEVEELRRQEEVEELRRQEEVEELRRQEEVEELRRQEEVEELRRQEEVEELRRQEETVELKNEQKQVAVEGLREEKMQEEVVKEKSNQEEVGELAEEERQGERGKLKEEEKKDDMKEKKQDEVVELEKDESQGEVEEVNEEAKMQLNNESKEEKKEEVTEFKEERTDEFKELEDVKEKEREGDKGEQLQPFNFEAEMENATWPESEMIEKYKKEGGSQKEEEVRVELKKEEAEKSVEGEERDNEEEILKSSKDGFVMGNDSVNGLSSADDGEIETDEKDHIANDNQILAEGIVGDQMVSLQDTVRDEGRTQEKEEKTNQRDTTKPEVTETGSKRLSPEKKMEQTDLDHRIRGGGGSEDTDREERETSVKHDDVGVNEDGDVQEKKSDSDIVGTEFRAEGGMEISVSPSDPDESQTVMSEHQISLQPNGHGKDKAETESEGAFGLLKNAFSFFSEKPATESAPSVDSNAGETSETQTSLAAEKEADSATDPSQVYTHDLHTEAQITQEQLQPSPPSNIQSSSPTQTHSHPSSLCPDTGGPLQTKTLSKQYKSLLSHMSMDETTTLVELLGRHKLQFLDYILENSETRTDERDHDKSILLDIEMLLDHHRETLVAPSLRLTDAPQEDSKRTRTLIALQKLEMMLVRVRKTFNTGKSDITNTNHQDTAEGGKEKQVAIKEGSSKTDDSTAGLESNHQRDEWLEVEEKVGQQNKGIGKDSLSEQEKRKEEKQSKDDGLSPEIRSYIQPETSEPSEGPGMLKQILEIVHQMAQMAKDSGRELLIWLTVQVVSSLPDDIRPGPDLYGVPWEPIIFSSLVGLVTMLLFTCRCYSSVKSRMYRSKERWMAEQVAQLLDEKCKVLEALSKCQQEHDELENSLRDSGVLAQTQKSEQLESEARQLEHTKREMEMDIEQLKEQLDQRREHRIEQERRIAMLEESMKTFEEETKDLQSQDEQAQTTLKVYSMNSDRLQRNLETAGEENTLLRESNAQLRQQVEGWAERVSELEAEMTRCEAAHSVMLQDVANKDERIMSLTDRLLRMKAWDSDLEEEEGEGGGEKETSNGTEGRGGENGRGDTQNHLQKVQKLIYAAKLNADLKSVDEDKDRAFAKLNDEIKAKEDLHERIQEMANEKLSLQSDTEHYSEQVQRLQQKLQIMTEMYQENELKLHRLLTVEEKERLQKEEKLNKADKNIAMAMEELNNYRKRAEEMEEELEKTKQSYQTQISAQEKKAHNNWLAARAADRELADIRRENALFRQKLTDTQFKLDALDKDPYALNSLARPLPFRAERSPYGPSPLGRPASETRAFLSPPTLMDGPPTRLSPRVPRSAVEPPGGQGEMERTGGPHSDSGSISPTWERDRRGPPPGPPGPLGHPGYMFPEPGGPIFRRPPPPPGALGLLPPPGSLPPGPLHPRGLPPGPPHPADMADGQYRENSIGPGDQEHRESGPGDRRTPPEADLRMGGPPPPGPPMGPMDGPFPRRAPYGPPPPDFYPPRGPGGPPMMPMWAPPPPGMMYPPRFPPGGPPLPPHPYHAPPMRPPGPDSLPPPSMGPAPPQQSLASPPHGQSPEEHRPSPEDAI